MLDIGQSTIESHTSQHKRFFFFFFAWKAGIMLVVTTMQQKYGCWGLTFGGKRNYALKQILDDQNKIENFKS